MDRLNTGRRLGVMALGAQSTLAQVALLRAGLERFGGNEFFIAVSLAVWLAAGAAGAALLGRLGDSRLRGSVLAGVGSGLVTSGLGLGLVILWIVSVRLSEAGISVHPAAAAGWMALATTPAAAMSGVLFAWLVPALAVDFGRGLERTTLLESFGAAIGGLIIGSLLIGRIGTPGIVATVVILGGLAILGLAGIERTVCRINLVAGTLIMTAVATWAAWAIVPVHSGAVLQDRIENRFGRRVAVITDRQKTIVQGSRTVVDCADAAGPEFLATTVAGLSPDAKTILAAGATSHDLARLAGLPGRKVTLITPDSALDNLDRQICRSDLKNQINIRQGLFIQEISGNGESYDAIVVKAGKPDTLDRSGMLTRHAFWKMASRIRHQGRLFVTLGPVEIHPTDAAIRTLTGVIKAASSAFPHCRLLPLGDWVLTCGQNQPNTDSIATALASVELDRRFATDTFLNDALDPFELDRLQQRIDEARSRVFENAGMLPAAHLDSLLDWAGRHTPELAGRRFQPGRVWVLAGCALPFVLVLLLLMTRSLRRNGVAPYAAAILTGATGMMVELALMWTVQSAWGALPGWLGGIIAAYMAGLGFGAWLARHWTDGTDRPAGRCMIKSTGATGMGAMAAIPLAIWAGSGLSPLAGIPMILALTFAVAAASGAAFQAAAQHLRKTSRLEAADMTGRLRAADTAAAALAAILAPLLLFPVAGIAVSLAAAGIPCLILALHKQS